MRRSWRRLRNSGRIRNALKKLPASWKKKQKNLQRRNRDARIASIQELAQAGPQTRGRRDHWDPAPYLKDPVGFASDILQFTPTTYQAELLRDEKKRIVVIYPRQSGKTTTLAVRMIWYA